MDNEKRIIVLSARPYKVDVEGGKKYEGFTLNFLATDTLEPTKGDDGLRGYLPMKSSIPSAISDELISVPGVYDVSFTLKQDPSKGLVAKITELKHVDCILSVEF